MILRNSKNSILRTPLKTILFTLLIVAVTAFLYLGINTWYSSAKMLAECDENYTTIAVLEYIGEDYPVESVYDEGMLEAVSNVDYSSISGNENVLSWEPTDCSVGLIQNFSAHSELVPYQNACVLLVKDVYELSTGGVYYAYVENAMYSYCTDIQGRHVYLYPDGCDFEPERGSTYVIHGMAEDLSTAVISIHFSPFSSRAAQRAGVDCEGVQPFMQTDGDKLLSDPKDIYMNIADYYRVMNNKVYVYSTGAVEDREEFHQGWLAPIEGRLFTEAEQENCEKVCIITETIAKSCGLHVGDKVTVSTTSGGGEPAADCYWGAESLDSSDEYEIVGVVNYYSGLQYNVYIPGRPTGDAPVKYIYILGQATLKNGSAEQFREDIAPLLPIRMSVNIYDQGYQTVADSLNVIIGASAVLTLIATVAAVMILLCFAYLFVEKQRSTVKTMRCFGMTGGEVRLYLLFGAGLIALTACAAGALIGTRCAGLLISGAYRFISELQAIDLRYSDGYLGLIREYSPVSATSASLAVAVAGVVFALSLVLCLYFAKRTIDGRVTNKKKHTQRLKPPARSSTALAGAGRYAFLSMRRGGARTFVVPVISLAMALFILTLMATMASYTRAKETLCDSTVIPGYLVTLRGKYAGNLVVEKKYVQRIIDSGYVENASVSYHKCYGYLGVAEHADGSAGDAKDVPCPINSFALALELDRLASSPYLVFTNDVSDAPEFFFSQYTAQYMQGYGADSLNKTDWVTPLCMVSTRFMEDNGVGYGDVIRVYVRNGTSYSADQMPFSNANEQEEGSGAPFLGIEMKVIGSFIRQGSEEQIYCQISDGIIDLDGLSAGEEPAYYRYLSSGMYRRSVADVDLSQADMQTVFRVLLDESHISSASFTLKDPRDLANFKDFLEEEGFSGPKQDRKIRVAVMLRDYDFSKSMSSISQRSRYMEILYPVLLALCCIVGAITAFLMVNSRREEAAIMRGMGVKRGRIFRSFFYEQVVLLILGAALAAAVWASFGQSELLALPDPYSFAVSYALGAAVSLVALDRKRALDAISARE